MDYQDDIIKKERLRVGLVKQRDGWMEDGHSEYQTERQIGQTDR